MELKVVGLMNIQYAIYEDIVYILEANPQSITNSASGLKSLQYINGKDCNTDLAGTKTVRF